ncbi:hypothetical protein MNQ96_04865 [Sphingopyxis granuli]|uniref:hypothetical protein n=1 Tax=Sphingopyxis granuli TaxID=267128 RepID=UPI001F532EC3|nr:hypothetical protein [Sphingopyxis granuli]UNK80415.1 hypothetical protein MNQ96_04865 [Sphingopyxis granuli]
MIGGAALGARAIGDASGRILAAEWRRPDRVAPPRARVRLAPDPARRIAVDRP